YCGLCLCSPRVHAPGGRALNTSCCPAAQAAGYAHEGRLPDLISQLRRASFMVARAFTHRADAHRITSVKA
ncbi:MAG TPA: hypothetical protein VFT66_21135, partial [Roseiflexaceae bacterium]|nr:hypothetical protein [Roseiflexaceae bacterium]